MTRAALQQSSREPHGVDDGRSDSPPREALDLAVEEREVEAGVVRDEGRVAGERDEAPHGNRDPGTPRELAGLDAGEVRHGRRERNAGVDEGLLVERAAFGRAAGTEDSRIGTKAFVAKQKPEFIGR